MRLSLTILLTFAAIAAVGLNNSASASELRPDSTSYELKLEDGIEAFYRSDWAKADQLFAELQKQSPDDARAYFFESMIPFWKYYFGDNSAESADRFLEQS